MTDKVIATLKHGMFYDYNGKVWDNHKAHVQGQDASNEVTPAEEEYLREHAIIHIEVDGTDYSKNRFVFSNDEPPKTRKRVRAES